MVIQCQVVSPEIIHIQATVKGLRRLCVCMCECINIQREKGNMRHWEELEEGKEIRHNFVIIF